MKLKKLVNGQRISIRNVPTGKTGLPFQNLRGCLPFTKGFWKIRLKSEREHNFWGHFGGNGSNGTSLKVVLFFRSEYFIRKFMLFFFKAIFETNFRLSRPFFGKWN